MEAGDPATIRVTAPGLGFDSGPIDAAAFDTTVVPLPDLTLGTHTITFSATTGSGSSARTDRLTRTFDVVTTRLTTTGTAYVELPHAAAFEGGTGLTRVIVSDAGSGRYLSLLTDLAAGGGARLDRGLAADIAADLLGGRIRRGPAIPSTRSCRTGYQTGDGGLALLPYSSSDLELSCLVALFAPHVSIARSSRATSRACATPTARHASDGRSPWPAWPDSASRSCRRSAPPRPTRR